MRWPGSASPTCRCRQPPNASGARSAPRKALSRAPPRRNERRRTPTISLDHTTFRQNGKRTAGQSQFVAEDLRVVLADQRCPSGDPPGRAIIDRRFAGVDKAAAELRVLHLLPEAAVSEVGVVKERLRRTHRPPGEAAFLGSVVDLLCRQAGNEVGDEIIDYVRCVRRNDRRV